MTEVVIDGCGGDDGGEGIGNVVKMIVMATMVLWRWCNGCGKLSTMWWR